MTPSEWTTPTTNRHTDRPADLVTAAADHDLTVGGPGIFRRDSNATGAWQVGDDDLDGFLNRTNMLVGTDALRVLAGKTVAVAGCGGVGGAAAITLTRMGVGGFTLADPADFDAPDINRQWAASLASLGHNKAMTYADTLRSINPSVRLSTFTDGVQPDNMAAFLEGADVVIDCLDVAVPPQLRLQLYQTARAKGLYCLTAPMLGFGSILVTAAPDGMPMEALYGPVFAEAVATSKLPERLRDLVVPEHLDAIELHLRNMKAPSVAVSPMLSASLICTEIFLILLGEGVPGWRPPTCLPDVMVVDPIRSTFRVLPLQDLVAVPPTATAVTPAERQAALVDAGRNPNRLPQDVIAVDLLSDSWRERLPRHASGQGQTVHTRAAGSDASLEDLLQALYGYTHNVPVFRGRFAEALLSAAAIRPGDTVVTNAIFPTTRYHLTAAGAMLADLSLPEAHDSFNSHPFKGELDLDALDRALANGGAAKVQAVYLELCPNAIGGHPLRLSHLRAVRDRAVANGVPVFLDATRAYANAVLLREREPGLAERPLVDIVRDLCACSTACATSLSKDFVTAVGGFVGTHDEAMLVRLRDLATLAYGDGLHAADRAMIADALSVGAPVITGDSPSTAADPGVAGATGTGHAPCGHSARAATVRALYDSLVARSIPVAGPPGGHAVYVDAAACLPHLGTEAHRTVTLANALFVEGGVRAAANPGTPWQAAEGVDLLRLAVPVGGLGDDEVALVADTFQRVLAGREAIVGLRRLDGIGGQLGELMASYVSV